MSARPRTSILLPLLSGYRAALRHRSGEAATPGARESAILSARSEFLAADFIDGAADAELLAAAVAFYRAAVPLSWHAESLTGQAPRLRFALCHLLNGDEPLGVRVGRCASPGAAYWVPGLGPAFWYALAKALGPDVVPDWTPGVVRGAVELGLLTAGQARQADQGFTHLARTYAGLAREFADLDALRLDVFLARAANLRGRELGAVTDPHEVTAASLAHAIRGSRTLHPTRALVAAFGEESAEAKARLDAAVAAGDPAMILDALGLGGEPGPWVLEALEWAGRPRTPGDFAGLDDPGAVGVAAAVLAIRSPVLWPRYDAAARRAVRLLSDAVAPELPPGAEYALACEVMTGLRERFRLHPAELPPLLELVAAQFAPPALESPPWAGRGHFRGFCRDSFYFLRELAAENRTEWMGAQRERYHFAVRRPVLELCEALADQYVRPVLLREYGWNLGTDASPGRAVSSINRNDFGRSTPYSSEVWVSFYADAAGATRRTEAQFGVRLTGAGVWYGVSLPKGAREAGRRFRAAVQAHGERLFAALVATGAVEHCEFGGGKIASASDLRAWAAGKELAAGRFAPAESDQYPEGELAGEILLTFDRLVPLFSAAADADPLPVLDRRAGKSGASRPFGPSEFRAATYLPETWLARAESLLALKKQLVFQGVPGTGKTHVARQLARYLTGDRGRLVRLVQFHPGYSYEEFVEGIRPQTPTEGGGVTYAVEPGLLASFVTQAQSEPSEPHVLVIDELNRGNLPRVFGELLFLLEYRDQEVTLPYSKRPFRLPDNLVVLATMNPADQSVGQLDQALRRRFSFIDLPPDAGVLARYFAEFPPSDADESFGPRVVKWFEELNRKVARDAGVDRQLGHSFLMVPGLTRERFDAIWQHQMRPLLEAAYPGQPGRLEALEFGKAARAEHG